LAGFFAAGFATGFFVCAYATEAKKGKTNNNFFMDIF
jgi:hypothetical protein